MRPWVYVYRRGQGKFKLTFVAVLLLMWIDIERVNYKNTYAGACIYRPAKPEQDIYILVLKIGYERSTEGIIFKDFTYQLESQGFFPIYSTPGFIRQIFIKNFYPENEFDDSTFPITRFYLNMTGYTII
jgi:hypothetical protein